MKHITLAHLAMALVGGLCAVSAFAVDPHQHQMPTACQADAAKLCPGMTAGDHKLGQCMREHHDQVSDGCKSAIKELRQERREHRGHAPHAASGAAGKN